MNVGGSCCAVCIGIIVGSINVGGNRCGVRIDIIVGGIIVIFMI